MISAAAFFYLTNISIIPKCLLLVTQFYIVCSYFDLIVYVFCLQDEYKIAYHNGRKVVLCERIDMLDGIDEVSIE